MPLSCCSEANVLLNDADINWLYEFRDLKLENQFKQYYYRCVLVLCTWMFSLMTTIHHICVTACHVIHRKTINTMKRIMRYYTSELIV